VVPVAAVIATSAFAATAGPAAHTRRHRRCAQYHSGRLLSA
jgi:hypothetical protein